jgi:hypothetical protein
MDIRRNGVTNYGPSVLARVAAAVNSLETGSVRVSSCRVEAALGTLNGQEKHRSLSTCPGSGCVEAGTLRTNRITPSLRFGIYNIFKHKNVHKIKKKNLGFSCGHCFYCLRATTLEREYPRARPDPKHDTSAEYHGALTSGLQLMSNSNCVKTIDPERSALFLPSTGLHTRSLKNS